MNLVRSWNRFWFTPIDAIGLTVLRVLGGLLILYCLLPLAGQVDALFGLQGYVDREAITRANRLLNGPPQLFGWSVSYLFTTARSLQVAYWFGMGAVALFTLGIAARLTSILTWITVASFTANPAVESDADCLLLILALYLMVGHVLQGLRGPRTWANWLLGPRPLGFFSRSKPAAPSLGANVALRLLQVHFALVLLTNGLHKLQFGEWWAGVALWYPLYPPLETSLNQARAHAGQGATTYLFGLSLAAYVLMAWQIGFSLFAWRPGARPLLLGGAFIGALAEIWLYRVPGLAPAFFLCCLSYLTAREWRTVLAALARLAGRGQRAVEENGRDTKPALVIVEGR
jgi:hypothetical protein